MRTTLPLLISLAALWSASLAAQDDMAQASRPVREATPRQKLREALTFRRLEMSGEEVADNVQKLKKELRWHKTLSSALASGRIRRKPVVWIQALGDLDGFL